MLIFNYGSTYFSKKVVLTKFISGCRMVWDFICGTSWSAVLPNWCCLLFITVLSGYPCFTPQANFSTHNLNFYQMKAMGSDPGYFLKSFILWWLFTGILQQLNLLVLFAAYSTHSGFVAQFKRGQILELLFEILWFLPINPFTLPIFDPSPQKNWDVIYGPLLGLILT